MIFTLEANERWAPSFGVECVTVCGQGVEDACECACRLFERYVSKRWNDQASKVLLKIKLAEARSTLSEPLRDIGEGVHKLFLLFEE